MSDETYLRLGSVPTTSACFLPRGDAVSDQKGNGQSVWLNTREQRINREPGLGGRQEFVPRSVADRLAEALELITRDDCMTAHGETGSWIDTEAPARIAEDALVDFRTAYPLEETA